MAIATSIACFSSCGSKQETQANYSDLASKAGGQTQTTVTNATLSPEMEQWHFVKDSTVVANSKNVPTVFEQSKAKVYFVQKWNTPDYQAFDNQQTGRQWDTYAFYGYEKGDYVYYIEEYKISSDKVKEMTNTSSVMTENKFPKTGVTTDPRTTCSWISTVQSELKKNETED